MFSRELIVVFELMRPPICLTRHPLVGRITPQTVIDSGWGDQVVSYTCHYMSLQVGACGEHEKFSRELILVIQGGVIRWCNIRVPNGLWLTCACWRAVWVVVCRSLNLRMPSSQEQMC
jgi:hypothetical protein